MAIEITTVIYPIAIPVVVWAVQVNTQHVIRVSRQQNN